MTSFVGRGLAPAAVLFGQPTDACPYSERTSVYFLSYQKALRGATRRRSRIDSPGAVNSQSGEQFIIATGGVSRDTVAAVVTGDFFASFFFA